MMFVFSNSYEDNAKHFSLIVYLTSFKNRYNYTIFFVMRFK